MTDFGKLCDPLSKEDIEFRIGNSNGRDGFSLLAYKTARVDTKRLNDVFGAGWSNKFFYDDKGLLCCEISIYSKELGQWVGRTDVGTESQTEKEKGLYSDAFKRAGFKWGIGAELYDFPFMWVKWDKWDDRNGKKYPKFMAGNIKIEEYLFKDGEVEKLKLSYDGKVIYEIGKNIKVDDDKAADKQMDIVLEIEELITKSGTDRERFLAYFQVDSIEKLPYEKAIKSLNTKLEKQKLAEAS